MMNTKINILTRQIRDKIHDTSHWLGSTSIGKGKMSKLGQMEKEVEKLENFQFSILIDVNAISRFQVVVLSRGKM